MVPGESKGRIYEKEKAVVVEIYVQRYKDITRSRERRERERERERESERKRDR